MARYRHQRPDPSTADRLLAGRIGPDDAPPGYRRVAALLDEAAGGFPEPAGASDAATVSAMAAAIQDAPAPAPGSAPRRSPMLRKLLAAKTIAAVGFVALSASGAAAATGNLPDAVQEKVAKAAKHVGLDLPGVERKTDNCPKSETGASADAAPTFKNRGQYLKWVRENNPEGLEAAKKSDCGMPFPSKGTPGADEAGETEAPETPGSGDQGQSGQDHGQAGDDHGQAGDDHGQAGGDQGQAGEDPGRAGEDPRPPVGTPAPDHPAPDEPPTGDDHPLADEVPGLGLNS